MRVFIPLVIGMFTIIPAVWAELICAVIYQARSPGKQGDENLWTAARSGNLQIIQSEIGGGVPLNQRDPIFGATPLSLATWHDNTEIVEARPPGRSSQCQKPLREGLRLHGAVLMGREKAFDMLLDHEARLTERDRGETRQSICSMSRVVAP